LTELLVSIAIIGILAALLLTSLSRAKGKSLQAVCLNNLRQIGISMTVYAGDNHDVVIPARRNNPNDLKEGSFVQIALDPQTVQSARTVGLEVGSSNRPSVWTCPDRPGLPVYEKITAQEGIEVNQWIIGYQYFGGITNWVNPSFEQGIPSRSPVRLTSSKPTWCLAADAVIKAGQWGAISTYHPGPPFENMPPHGKTRLEAPPGGNQLFVDGSARWIKFEQMHFLTTWKGATQTRQAFFYQDPSDFDPALVKELPNLAGPLFK
jgi:type II secretory pathway pseudopilin PulG